MIASTAGGFSEAGVEIWIVGLVAVLLGTGIGFASGLYFARWRDNRAFQQARSGITQLFKTMILALESAQEVCSLLEKQSGTFLRPEQTEQLVKKRSRLMETLSNIVTRHEKLEEADVNAIDESNSLTREFAIEWITEPEDEGTGLPGRKAFDANLALLTEEGRELERDSGLLMLRIDKFNSLKKRLGITDCNKLMKKLTNVVCRAVRDQDLVCRYSADMLAVLMPDTDLESGRKIAGAVRDSVRAYHFRVEEHGPETFVTASFGYSICRPQDNSDLVVNRGADALSKSQQRGRNQLHAHNGSALQQCLAG